MKKFLLILCLLMLGAVPAQAQVYKKVTGPLILTGSLTLCSACYLAWGTDTFLFRDAADTLAMRNGTTSQAFRVYNTDNGADDEYLEFMWESNILRLRTVKTGAGTQRGLSLDGSQLFFRAAGTSQWTMTTTAFAPVLNNLETLGTASVRPSVIYTNEINAAGITGTGKAVCVKADGDLGVCSDAVGAGGTCTCS